MIELSSALMTGIKETGINIISLGLVTTPMYYYACIKLGIYSGVMVTASHNPKDDNGFKFAFDESGNCKGQEIQDFLEYIYDELTYRIAKKCVDTLIGKIKALPQSLSANESGIYDSVSAAKITTAPALGTIAEAVSKLSDEARDITIVMNKETYATFKAVQYAGNYGIDIFEGHRVVFNNSFTRKKLYTKRTRFNSFCKKT